MMFERSQEQHVPGTNEPTPGVEKVRSFVKAQFHTAIERQWNAEQKKKAARVYRYLVVENLKCALSLNTENRIRDYAIEVLGSKTHIPWLRVYAAYAGEWKEGWLPGNYFSRTVAPHVTLRTSAGAKSMIRRVLQDESVPDVGYFLNSFWLDRNYEEIPPGEIVDRLFEDRDSVIVKVDRSYAGKGVSRIRRADFDLAVIRRMGNVVFQRPIEQHEELDRFCSDNCATIRITTVKTPGTKARNCGGHIRFGRNGSDIVNVDEHVRAPVEDEATGTVGARGNGKRWLTFETHPDSGLKFGGFVIPGYPEAVRLCEALHDRNPLSMIIGWDIAIGRDGEPIIMEWNLGRVGIRYMEAAQGPCFLGTGWESIWRETKPAYSALPIRATLDPVD
ncbi:MAG: sugar-transfer associated ATP-grasp domain-containing protein [Pseudomonadota bacterium]